MYIKDMQMRTSKQQNHLIGMAQGESTPLTADEQAHFEESASSVFNNMAAVYVRQKKYSKAVVYTTQVGEIELARGAT